MRTALYIKGMAPERATTVAIPPLVIPKCDRMTAQKRPFLSMLPLLLAPLPLT